MIVEPQTLETRHAQVQGQTKDKDFQVGPRGQGLSLRTVNKTQSVDTLVIKIAYLLYNK